jgi:hypothetical protein
MGVRFVLSVHLSDQGLYRRYVYADNGNEDVQISLQAREMLGRKAPPLSIAKWFNSKPVALDELRGKVVLLLVGVLARLSSGQFALLGTMYERYGAQGLEVVAVHHSLDMGRFGLGRTSETAIQSDVEEREISFAVCLDDEYKTWTAYRANVTPTLYLIDKQGYVRALPNKAEVEESIKTLLAE